MPDPDPGAVEESVPAPVALGPFDVPVDAELKPGQRWRDFVIETPFPGGGAHTYLADHVGLMEKVVVRARPIEDSTEWRRGAWERLCLVADSKIVRCIEAHEESGWRYEVTTVPPPMTLRDWLAVHRPGFSDIEALMRQMVATLAALHAEGVVHLNIRPESIHLDDSGRDPIFLLGGLGDATLYTQPKLTSLDIDPLYAPPEAMEPETLRSGTLLCAWDWWSVGRVVQELLLGRHVLSLVLDREVTRLTLELRAPAEALLRETAPPGVRAGALEYMPENPATAGLLRGLLTSSCEARWGLDAVQRWLRRESVRDHYNLPRAARLWIWHGRGFELTEAVEFFTRAMNWADGEDVLFNQSDPESLAHFLEATPESRADWDRLQAVCEFIETPAWEQVPMIARRTATAALAWLSLAVGGGARVPFRVLGQTIDLTGLTELLKRPNGEGVALVSALSSPAVIEFLEPLDSAAARVLRTLAASGGAAVQLALEQGWLDPHNSDDHGKILALALQRTASLRERAALLTAAYATSRNPYLAALLAKREASMVELVLLVFTGEAPEQYGYVTHADWRREREADLLAQARRVTTAFFWVRLRRLFAVARFWGFAWPVFAAITLALASAAAWFARAAEPAAGVAGALLLSRAWLWWRVRGALRRLDPAASPWNWRDGRARAEAEAQRVLAETKMSPAELAAERARIRTALAELVAPKVVRRALSGLGEEDLGFALAAGAVLAAISLGHAIASPRPAPRIPPPPAPVIAHVAPAAGKAAGPEIKLPVVADSAAPAPTVDLNRLLATGRYEVLDDGFGRRLRGPLLTWDFPAPPLVPALTVGARAPASPEQAAFALVSGNLLVQAYTRKSVNVLVAVRVPTRRGTGILIFNTRDRRLDDHDVLLVDTPLEEHTWYRLGTRRVVYLGTPPPLAAEISLAPP